MFSLLETSQLINSFVLQCESIIYITKVPKYSTNTASVSVEREGNSFLCASGKHPAWPCPGAAVQSYASGMGYPAWDNDQELFKVSCPLALMNVMMCVETFVSRARCGTDRS